MVQLLESIWNKNPDMRLGQVVLNVMGYKPVVDIFNQEDSVTMSLLSDVDKDGWNKTWRK